MTIKYVTENNTKCYGVIFQNSGWVKIQKFEDISDEKKTINCVKPLEILLGKSEYCMMTAFSGAFNKPVIDGNTILLEKSEKNNKNRCLYVGGDMVCSILTNDKLYKYISNVGNTLIPYSIDIGEKNSYFFNPDFKFIKRGNFKYCKSTERNENFVDLFDYHDSNCRKDSFKKIGIYKIHSNYDN